jgi:hypothetical protein
VELLGEEVDTKVAVLAGGSRGRDADDLARAALKDEDVAQADVVAGDCHRVGGGRVGGAADLTDLAHLDALVAFMVEGVRDTVSQLVQALTERVVVAVLVVVAHLGSLFRSLGAGSFGDLFDNVYLLVVGRARSRGVNGGTGDLDRLLVNGNGAGGVDGVLVDVGASGSLEAGGQARDVNGGAGDAVFLAVAGLEAGTVLALSNVNYRAVGASGSIDLDMRLGVG